MIKKTLFLIFGGAIILFYVSSSWFGWEFANAGSKSRFHAPFFFYGSGFRGGK